MLTRTGPPRRRHDEARTRKCLPTLPTPSVQGQNARGMPLSEYAQVSRREAGARGDRGREPLLVGRRGRATTTPSTGPSSATPTSSGGRRAGARTSCGLLGDAAGRRVLEIGAGAGQCARWVAAAGAQVVATDLSAGMVRQGLDLNRKVTDPARPVPFAQCDAVELPFAEAQLRHRVHGLRRRPLRRRHGPADARGGPGAPPRAAGSSSRPPTRSAGPSPTTRAPGA